MKKIFLFDVDGTLTEARSTIKNDMITTLESLSNIGIIGLLTGSNLDYLLEQVTNHLSDNIKEKILLFPCNGTKKYKFINNKLNKIYSTSIKQMLSNDQYKSVIEKLMSNQLYLMRAYKELPLTGNFISYRESMINWCPIGRDAGNEERETFKRLDKIHNIREPMINVIQKFFDGFNLKLKISLGGDTSFDIFPIGWDKTYVLKHFDLSQEEIFFVGDRCENNGNDYEIYQKINNIKNGNGIKAKNPGETIEIIRNMLLK